jgi:hypothetical protein
MGRKYHLSLRALAFAILALVCLTVPVSSAERVALVIGNGKYVDANALANPPNDARAVAKALTDIGFDVAFGQDLNRTEMERLVGTFLRKAVSAKIALLFYAGHGLQVDGRNYLMPIDARLEAASDLSFQTIRLDDIIDNLSDPVRANIILLDACRDNPLARSFAARLGASRSTAVSTGLAAYSTLGTGTLIAFSTAPGQVAFDGDGANSPFTQGLIKHLATPGLEVRQMLTRVRNDVARSTGDRQVPWDNSSLRGDVYLNAAPGTVTTIPAPAASPPGPGADEVAWDFVRDSRDPAQLRHFIEQFPKSVRLIDAAKKLAALEQPPTKSESAPADIARQLQAELRRVGCFTAEPDGDWNARSRSALEMFNKHSGSRLDTKLASLDTLDAVRGKPSRVCPLICGQGQHLEGEQCVATICKDGYAIGEDGSCERVRERHREGGHVRLGPWERVPGRQAPARAAGPGGQQALPPGIQLGCPPAVMPCATDRIVPHH